MKEPAPVNWKTFLWSALALAVFLPALFFVSFGVLAPYAIGFTVAMVVLCLLIALGLHSHQTHTEQGHKSLPTVRTSRLQWVAAFWLPACFFGPAAAWLVGSLGYGNLPEEQLAPIHVAVVTFTVILPVATGILNLIYMNRRYWITASVIVIAVTALPVAVGIPSLRCLVQPGHPPPYDLFW